MNKRINRKDMLPQWFDLSSYEVMNDLDDYSLILQLITRREMYKSSIVSSPDFLEVMQILHPERDIVMEFSEHYYAYLDNEYSKRYSDLQMSAIGGVSPLNLLDTVRYANIADKYIEDNSIKRSLRGLKRSLSKVANTDNSMLIKIDMTWPDELILKDIGRLLSIWRQELNIKNEDSLSSQSWEVIKRKIFDYRVFPMIDLLTWAKSTGRTITKGVLTVAIFEDGRYDYTHITQTIKPFIDNLMRKFYLEKIRREVINKK